MLTLQTLHVYSMLKRRFNVEYTWNVCREQGTGYSSDKITIAFLEKKINWKVCFELFDINCRYHLFWCVKSLNHYEFKEFIIQQNSNFVTGN